MDIGATKTVMGRPQAEAYHTLMGLPVLIKHFTKTLLNSVRIDKKVCENLN